MSLVPIDKVVRDACRTMGDTSYSKYMQCIQFANAAYRELSLYVIPNVDTLTVKTETLSCGTTKAILLPEDFVYETKVGICRNGRIAVLTINEDMCVDGVQAFDHCDCPCEEDEQAVNDILCGCEGNYGQYTFYNGVRNGNLGEYYGMGLGHNINGYYRIDKKKNVLYLNGVNGDDEIIIEYKSNGVGSGAELIPTEAENCIQEYIFWQMYRFSDKSASSMAQENWRNDYNKLKKLYLSYSYEDWHHMLLRTNKPTVKS